MMGTSFRSARYANVWKSSLMHCPTKYSMRYAFLLRTRQRGISKGKWTQTGHMKLPLNSANRPPQQCTILDLEGADYIVALNEMEHRPLMSERFPNWESRIQYWKIGDVELVQPTKALALIDVLFAAIDRLPTSKLPLICEAHCGEDAAARQGTSVDCLRYLW